MFTQRKTMLNASILVIIFVTVGLTAYTLLPTISPDQNIASASEITALNLHPERTVATTQGLSESAAPGESIGNWRISHSSQVKPADHTYTRAEIETLADKQLDVVAASDTHTGRQALPASADAADTGQFAATEPSPSMTHHRDTTLGFAVEHPSNWEVTASSCWPYCGELGHVQFISDLSSGIEQSDGHYRVTVSVAETGGETLTETVELALSTSKRAAYDRTTSRCCLMVDDEMAMEITILPGEIMSLPAPTPPGVPFKDEGVYRVVSIHEERLYTLSFEPNPFDEQTDDIPREMFAAFLRDFTFIPITGSPIPASPPPPPPPTP